MREFWTQKNWNEEIRTLGKVHKREDPTDGGKKPSRGTLGWKEIPENKDLGYGPFLRTTHTMTRDGYNPL